MDEVEEKEEGYQSRNGFEIVPMIRGFYEIRALYELITPFDSFICGGYARYCASPQKSPVMPDDVDVYCQSDTGFESLKTALVEQGIALRHENDMAITYKRAEKGLLAYCPAIQIIKPFNRGHVVARGDRGEILSNFDFTVVRAAIMDGETVMVDADFVHDEQKRMLRLKNIHCPISSTLRCMKYARKGYWMKPFEVIKLFLDWDGRDQDYRDKLIHMLEESATGKKMTQEEVDELEALMRID
jgi:hypothetical protein